ncbi:MAG TPA: hypothetical protein VM240_02840 [Verrucomicrobiae bacterium]|nr:hypothetical protein [Verrucomicrobiae bacterium]
MKIQHAALLACLSVSACGEYAGAPAPVAGTPPGGGTTPGNINDFVATRITPRLEFCRDCHVPDGIADTALGEKFMLSPNAAEDYAKLRASWEALGGGIDDNRILLKSANIDPERHSGGAAWPLGSVPYADAKLLLTCWQTPAACSLTSLGPAPTELPLLGSARGGHYHHDFCAGKPDSTVVPADPRELVTATAQKGKAVYMNVDWRTCQADNHPGTCGELRARVQRGFTIVAAAGQTGAGTFFAGSSSDSGYAFPASDYAAMWQSIWEMDERPDNFDQLVAERWGMPLSPTRNPYPLPGEDASTTDGGSGQLPMGLTQLRNADGSWTGNLNVTCSICHGGGVGVASEGTGLGAMYGTNSLSDITVMFTDLARLVPQQGALAGIAQNKVRGTGNITNFQLFGTLTLTESFSDPEALAYYLAIQGEPSTGTEDPPVWWNGGHRVGKFFDAGLPWDAKRIELSFHFPNTPNHPDMAADKQWILDNMQDSDAWITSLRSPAWPEGTLGAIDTELAERGAVLFHNKDLWADKLENPVGKPEGGNGSCASCHGAYSPRYVNDPAFLVSPLLEGVAAHVVPLEVIETDSKRLDGNSDAVVTYSRYNWFAYPDGPLRDNGAPACGNHADAEIRGDWAPGYLAPPLYGVWATAPYFHNGAVPDLTGVLDAAERPAIWRRLSKAPRADQAGTVVMGYDERLATGYDAARIGWKYDELICGTGSLPFVDCDATGMDAPTAQDALGEFWLRGGLAWNIANPPIMTDEQIEERKVYNTFYYSQSNAGHAFTDVLTAAERRALIEYLKTL